MPLTVAEKQYTGEEKQGYSLVFGTNRVKFFLNSSIGTGNYDKITERTQWSLFGLPLPVTFVKETFRFYETVPAEVSAAQAESRGEAILTDYLHTLVDPLRHRQLYPVHFSPGGGRTAGDTDGGVCGGDRPGRAHLHRPHRRIGRLMPGDTGVIPWNSESALSGWSRP